MNELIKIYFDSIKALIIGTIVYLVIPMFIHGIIKLFNNNKNKFKLR